MANRQAVVAFVHALALRLALEMQKLGYRALDDVIAAARHIEHLQKDYPSPNMDNLESIFQHELRAKSPKLLPQIKPYELHSPFQPQQSMLT